jgi:hypothetical protein
MTPADLKQLRAGASRRLPGAKPSKYSNQKTTVDGIVFDSKKEAQRYHELKLMEKAGLITRLTLQPRFPLVVNGQLIGAFVADFSYLEGETLRVEDCKGMATLPLAKWKQRHFTAQTGIPVVELR